MKRVTHFFKYILVFVSFTCVAKDLPSSRYIPVQAQGMGNAFLPLAEDNLGGLFYQPSALAKVRKNTIDVINLQFEGNNDYIDTSSSVLNFSGLVTDKNSGKFPYIGAQAGLGFGFSGFSAGALYKQGTSATRQEDELVFKTKYQVIPAAGYGLRLADGVIRMGYSLQWVHQKSANKKIEYSDEASFSDDLDTGSALSHNFGFALTLPQQFLPSLDLVVRNINKANFSSFSFVPVGGTSSGSTPESDPMSIDASISIQPKVYQSARAYIVAQLQDLNNRSNTAITRRLSVGTQIGLGRTLRLRLGVSEGYPTLGFGIERQNGSFDLSWYSIERGDLFRQDRDTRMALQLKISLD